MIGIGIDTGGTFTDAVVFDTAKHEVLAKCKRLTTKADLSIGIGNALDALPIELLRAAERVALSTTLATNACVEGKGGRAKLVLVGTTEEVLHRIDAQEKYGFVYEDTLAQDSHGSYDGSIVDEPDWDRLLADNAGFFSDADAIGIGELNALRNGAVIERNGARFLEEHLDVPVVQATSLAADINMMERGATALLNARLLPLIKRFMEAVHRALTERGLDLPVMIVRSDGSLMSDELARERPVETILSGPAASVSGARGLSDEPNCLIVDMGGTTTDISIVKNSAPVMTGGIRIGGWRTQIKGVYIDTIGLGGDSAVGFAIGGGLSLSSRRVQPLCMAASLWPEIDDKLERLLKSGRANRKPLHEFLYLAREPEDLSRYNEHEQRLIDMCAKGPVSLSDARVDVYMLDTGRLEAEGVLMRCGLTPTDAMHIKGDFNLYDVNASKLAARYFIYCDPNFRDRKDNELGILEIADSIYEAVEKRLFRHLIRVLLEERYPKVFHEGPDRQIDAMLNDAWRRYTENDVSNLFDLDFSTRATLIGIGAPTHIFLPRVARALNTRCIIPSDAEVANAVGAILADISVRVPVQIMPARGAFGAIEGYMVHSTQYNESFETLEEAQDAARHEATRFALDEARRRGAIGELFTSVEEAPETARGSDGEEVTLRWNYVGHANTVAS